MPPQLISCLGLVVMIFLAWLMSSHKRNVPWRMIAGGLALQIALAVLILKTAPGMWAFSATGDFFEHMLTYVDESATMLFGVNPRSDETGLPPQFTLIRTFAFGVLPTIIVFSSLMSVLYWLGLMQWVVRWMAVAMQWTLGISGAESLSAAANVFVGHTEAPLVIRPYVPGMTRSELNAVMVGGFSTISGGLLAAYAGMGIDPGHLITASVISAPAALLIAKVMQPETEAPQTLGSVTLKVERRGVNVIEAAAIGASDGMKLAINVAAMLIAFLALLAMLNGLVGWTGAQFGFVGAEGEALWSLEAALGYAFAPLAWLMGVESKDCLHAGELLGIKIVGNEFIAYDKLGRWIKGEDAVELSLRSQYILTYALSGFSNLGAIGIQIGGIGGIAPTRTSDLAQLGLRAMLGGALACCMTACVAGMLI